MLTSQTIADVEYNTISLLDTAQPAYDTSQSRPAMMLYRPTTGAINEVGQITGIGDAGNDTLNRDARPFFYEPSEQTAANLGDLTGDFADQSVLPRNDISVGHGLNDGGWVVGSSSTTTAVEVGDDRPFLWFDDDANHANTAGEMHELALNPGATYGSALAVNNNGQVLINGDSGMYLASFSMNGGIVTETAPRIYISNSVFKAKVNDAGDVIFQTENAGYVWRDLDTNDSADPNEITMIPAMSAVTSISAAYGISNAGQVCGTMRNEHGKEIAFIWSDLDGDNTFDWMDTNSNGYFESTETSDEVIRFHGDAGGIGSDAGKTFLFDINNHGEAVGAYYEGSVRKGFIYDTTLGMRFLGEMIEPDATIDLRQADAINDAGQITAIIKTPYFSTVQLVLLTPISESIPGDLDGDGFVGLSDLDLVLNNWNMSTPGIDPAADPTGDGFVGLDDLDVVLGSWNNGTPSTATMRVPEPVGLSALIAVLLLKFTHRRRTDNARFHQPAAGSL